MDLIGARPEPPAIARIGPAWVSRSHEPPKGPSTSTIAERSALGDEALEVAAGDAADVEIRGSRISRPVRHRIVARRKIGETQAAYCPAEKVRARPRGSRARPPVSWVNRRGRRRGREPAQRMHHDLVGSSQSTVTSLQGRRGRPGSVRRSRSSVGSAIRNRAELHLAVPGAGFAGAAIARAAAMRIGTPRASAASRMVWPASRRPRVRMLCNGDVKTHLSAAKIVCPQTNGGEAAHRQAAAARPGSAFP